MKKYIFYALLLALFFFACNDDQDPPILTESEQEETDNDDTENDDDDSEEEEEENDDEVESVNPNTLSPQDTPPPQNNSYTTETVVENMTKPWGMTFLPDGAMLITEISGDLVHFKDGTKTNIQNTPTVHVNGQGGLLDIKLHPEYEENGWIYLSYSSSEGDGNGSNTAIMRARLQETPLALIDNEVLYKASPNTGSGNHYAGRIEFDNDGFLYFSIGDRGNRDLNPQNVTRDGGKIYRLNDDGSIPTDNPFIGQSNAKEAIYSFGHRNPQGMVKHSVTGKIWVHEHGPQGGDEINIIDGGANYGWPVICHCIDYNDANVTDNTAAEGMEQPTHYWFPSIAPSGMTFVTSNNYPQLTGNLLVGSLKFQYLERLVLDADNNVTSRESLLSGIGRVRNVKQGPDGYIYVAVEGTGIVRLIEQ